MGGTSVTEVPEVLGATSLPGAVDEESAREFLERVRWPNGPVCPHCGASGAYRLRPKTRSARPVRRGVLKCKACRRQFTVTVRTAFEASHIPLRTWLRAIRCLCESGQGLSVYRLHRLVGVSHRTASFMARRILAAIGPRPEATTKTTPRKRRRT